MNQEEFTINLFKLLRETFEGPPAEGGNAYLDKGAGLFQTLDGVSAETASRAPWPGASTVAAHCYHARYYVDVLHNFLAGREQTVDWNASWQVSQMDAAEWESLKNDLRRAYDSLVESLESIEAWSDDPVGDSMAIVVHTAYHLGAIRQLLKAMQ